MTVILKLKGLMHMKSIETLLNDLTELRKFVKHTRELNHNEHIYYTAVLDEAINHITKQFALFEQFHSAVSIIQQLLPPAVTNSETKP